MLTLRAHQFRGHADHGWLDARHSFSFADYFDPAHTGFRALRVLNEDRIAPGGGFGTHGHRDMEIVTYVLSGALAHRDSLGHGETLRAGEIQAMTAGRGIRHSEANVSATEPVHLLQIWLRPDREGREPRYAQRPLAPAAHANQWGPVADPDGDGLPIHGDNRIRLARLDAGATLEYELAPDRHAWVQVVRGAVTLSGFADALLLSAGDGVAASDERRLTVTATGPAEVLLFDLA